MGGGAYCDGFASKNEAGYIFSTHSSGNGWIGACYPVSVGQTKTLITVYTLCATEVTGTAVIGKTDISLEDEERQLQEMRHSYENLNERR